MKKTESVAGAFEPKPIVRITNINLPCPESKTGHTLEGRNDDFYVCRHCGGVYSPYGGSSEYR